MSVEIVMSGSPSLSRRQLLGTAAVTTAAALAPAGAVAALRPAYVAVSQELVYLDGKFAGIATRVAGGAPFGNVVALPVGDGTIRKVTLERGSGNSEFDTSVVRAIQKSSPVPRPPEKVYQWFNSVRMTFDPRE